MARRLLLALALPAIVLAGCFGEDGSGSGGAGADGSDGADAGDDDASSGPYVGFPPGVEAFPLPAGSPALITGVAYDVTTGQAVTNTTLTALCIGPLGGPLASAQVPISEHGTFSLEGVSILAACNEVRYQVEAAGFEQAGPLTAAALTAGLQHVVHAGLQPTDD